MRARNKNMQILFHTRGRQCGVFVGTTLRNLRVWFLSISCLDTVFVVVVAVLTTTLNGCMDANFVSFSLLSWHTSTPPLWRRVYGLMSQVSQNFFRQRISLLNWGDTYSTVFFPFCKQALGGGRVYALLLNAALRFLTEFVAVKKSWHPIN